MYFEKPIIIIDFDETLYKKDSLIEFCKYVYTKHPLQTWAIIPQLIGYILHTTKLINTKKFKEIFLLFLYGIDEKKVSDLASDFWRNTSPEKFNSTITSLFQQLDYRIICISASPEIYLKPILNYFNIEYIGTRLKYINNKYLIEGDNCKGEEKVKRLLEYLQTDTINITESYSDSLSDLPIFNISTKKYLVDKKGRLIQLD